MDKKIRILKNLATALVIVAMVFAFLIAGIRVFGVQVYGVLTGSMEPSYPTGSLIYVKRVDPEDLRVNDVITYSISPNVIATHRIVEIVPDENNPGAVQYRTKGDANKDVDAAPVSPSNVIGKAMFAIPMMGYIANYIQHPPGIYVAILVCGLMIAFVFYTDSLETKKKNAKRRDSSRNYPPRTQQSAQRRYDYHQDDFNRRRDYNRREEYVPQRDYARRCEYPRQNAYVPRREYSRDNEYPRQREYIPQREYSRNREFSREREYSRERVNVQRSDMERRRAYSNSREERSDRT